MADDNSELSVKIFQHYKHSRKVLSDLKIEVRFLNTHLATLSEKRSDKKILKQNGEIQQILSEKDIFFNEIDKVKNQLDEMKNVLTSLELWQLETNNLTNIEANQAQNGEQEHLEFRMNRGRNNSKTTNNVDSGIGSATSACFDSKTFSRLTFDDNPIDETIEDQKPAEFTASKSPDKVTTVQEDIYTNDLQSEKARVDSSDEMLNTGDKTSSHIITTMNIQETSDSISPITNENVFAVCKIISPVSGTDLTMDQDSKLSSHMSESETNDRLCHEQTIEQNITLSDTVQPLNSLPEIRDQNSVALQSGSNMHDAALSSEHRMDDVRSSTPMQGESNLDEDALVNREASEHEDVCRSVVVE